MAVRLMLSCRPIVVAVVALGLSGCRWVLEIQEKERGETADAATGDGAGADGALDALVDSAVDVDAGPCGSGRALCGGACVDLANDQAHCGWCGHACGAPCDQGRCIARISRSTGVRTSNLVQSGAGFVFSSDAAGGRLRRVEGADGVTLASNTGPAVHAAVLGSLVYWTSPAIGTVNVVGIDGTGGAPLATGETGALGVATDGAALFFTLATTPGEVRRHDLAGGATTTIVPAIATPSAIVVDGSYVFYTATAAPDIGLWRAGKTGAGNTKIYGGRAARIAADTDFVYLVDPDASAIVRVKKSDGSTATIVTGATNVSGFDVDDMHVYFALSSGVIMRAPKTGGGPSQAVAVGQENPDDLVARDPTIISWATKTFILSAAK